MSTSRNPYFCPDCFLADYSRKSDSEILDMWRQWNAERDAAIAANASRQRAQVVAQLNPEPEPEPEPEQTGPALTSTYAADERAARAARAACRRRIPSENAEQERLYELIWAAGLSLEIQPRELAASPLLADAVARVAADRQNAGLQGVDPQGATVAARLKKEAASAGIRARQEMVASAPEPVRVAIEQQIIQSDRASGRELAYLRR